MSINFRSLTLEVFDTNFIYDCLGRPPSSCPLDVYAYFSEFWYPWELPHVTINTAYEVDPDERLIRNELLFITRVMITRLRAEHLSEHTIIPVHCGSPISLLLQIFINPDISR